LQHSIGDRKKEINNLDISGVIQQRKEMKETESGLLGKPSNINYLIGYRAKCS
jgi:hypothetical protein